MAKPPLAALRALYDSIAGRHETPPNSNRIFVWTDLIRWKLAAASFLGAAYCAAGQVWTLVKLKITVPDVASPFYCPSRVQWARAHGRWVSARDGRAGDEVFYAWTAAAAAAGLAEHVERLVRDVRPGDTTIATFGFNTGGTTAGSQANGDGCFYRTRPLDGTVLGCLRYHDFFAADPPAAVVSKQRANPFGKALRAHQGPLAAGARGDAVRAVQWAVGVPVDGVFGPATDHAVRLFQRFHQDTAGRSLTQDGQVGRLTRAQLLKVRHPAHT